MTKIVRPERIERAARRIAPSIPRGRSLIIDASGRRRLTRSQKVGVAGVPPDVATFVRTVVILALTGAILLASENAVKVAGEAIQALGGAGYTKDWPVERFLRDAKLLDIGAGTNEIRRMLIGRELIGAN